MSFPKDVVLYTGALGAVSIAVCAALVNGRHTPPEPAAEAPRAAAASVPSSVRPFFAAAKPDDKPPVVAEPPKDPCPVLQAHLRDIGCDPVSPRGPWLELCRSGIFDARDVMRANTPAGAIWEIGRAHV